MRNEEKKKAAVTFTDVVNWVKSFRPKTEEAEINYDIQSRLATSAVDKLANAPLYRRVWDRVTSPTGLRVLALTIAIVSIFTPLPYAIGVVSSVFSFASLAYGVYADVKRVRETRKMQESLTTLLDINELDSKITKEKTQAVGRYDDLIKDTEAKTAEPVRRKKHRVLEFVKKSPELGFCYFCTMATLDPGAAALSASVWVLSMINDSSDNVNYNKNMQRAEDTKQNIIAKQGLNEFGNAELAHFTHNKKAQLVAIAVVENELLKHDDLDVKECFMSAYQEALQRQYNDANKKHETPSWLSDLGAVLWSKGTSAVESSKMFNPNYIPEEIRGDIASDEMKIANEAAIVRRSIQKPPYQVPLLLKAVTNTGHDDVVRASTAVSHAIAKDTSANITYNDNVVQKDFGQALVGGGEEVGEEEIRRK